MSRSRSSRPRSVTDLLANLTDDVKEFVDDEVVDRAGVVEREARRVGRRAPGDRRRSRRSEVEQREIDELKSAVAELSQKVGRLVEARKSGRPEPPDQDDSSVGGLGAEGSAG
jgi:hypothetical protein